MDKITADCVDHALEQGLRLLTSRGIRQVTRAGEVLVMPHPVVTENTNPLNRVSFSARRDANPFFHLMEALWMLAGRNDARWLDQFIGDFSSRFAEEDGHLHGAYGFRWRAHFELEGGGGWPDQLEKVIGLLKKDPFDRRVVIAMWDPMADLGAFRKDVPCNTQIYPRIRNEGPTPEQRQIWAERAQHWQAGESVPYPDPLPEATQVLDLTVTCRSNDAVWGAHGANAVQFSVLQEYLAARIGVEVGKLYQLSNNYHVYTNILPKVWPLLEQGEHPAPYPAGAKLVADPNNFDDDLRVFFSGNWDSVPYANDFFERVAVPVRAAYARWRGKQYDYARRTVFEAEPCDWQIAAVNWFDRRINRQLHESEGSIGL